MNSSGLRIVPFSSISFNRKRKAEVSTIIQSRRAEFFASYQHQDFSLPDSIMLYIAKNPSSPELYEKMVQTCKEFFVKNPILVTSEFGYYYGKWQISLKQRQIDLSKIASKFWITDDVYVLPANSIDKKAVNQNILSSLMPKLYQFFAKSVRINNQICSFHDLSLLISAAERIHFNDVTVMDENDSNVEIEKIIDAAVKAKVIEIRSNATLSNITSNTMKELIKLLKFLKLATLTLCGIPETFDLETFCVFMKKNQTTKLWLTFDVAISEAYKNRLDKIVDEILATGTHGYKPPYICFIGLGFGKMHNLLKLHHSH